MYPYMSNTADAFDNKKAISASEKATAMAKDEDVKRLLSLISKGIESKQKAADKYKGILDILSHKRETEIVRSIYIEELKNKKLLEEIKSEIEYDTGISKNNEEMDSPMASPAEMPLSAAFNSMITAEIESARFYRDLAEVAGSIFNKYYDPILTIMNDDQNHAILDTMLFVENAHKEMGSPSKMSDH